MKVFGYIVAVCVVVALIVLGEAWIIKTAWNNVLIDTLQLSVRRLTIEAGVWITIIIWLISSSFRSATKNSK